jgi:hypothetical protein
MTEMKRVKGESKYQMVLAPFVTQKKRRPSSTEEALTAPRQYKGKMFASLC